MNENIRILKPFFRGLPIVILAVILSVLGAKKYLNYVTPVYESTAMLKLADVNDGVSGANLFKDLDVFASKNKIASEIEVLKSTTLIEKTLAEVPFGTEIYRKGDVQSVELFNNCPIHIEGTFTTKNLYDEKISLNINSKNQFTLFAPNIKEYKGTFGKPFSFGDGKLLITLNEDYINSKKDVTIIDNYQFQFLSHQTLMDKIYKNLDIVSVDKDVPVIRINLKSNVPEKSTLFVNKLAEMYIQDYIESKYKAANTTVSFLNEEIQGANKKLSQSEENIQNYRDDKNIINVHQETETDLRKISQLKIQQTNLKMNLDAIKDLNKYIASGKNDYLDLAANFEAFTDLLSTEMVKNMKKLQADKKDLLLTYTPDNEKVKIIDEKLKDLTDYQIESIKNTEKNLQIKYNDISRDIDESEKVFVDLPEKEKMLNILDRQFNLYEKNYNFLNEKRIDAEIARSAKIAFHKIISPAEIPNKPISPIRAIIIIVAALLGFLGSIIAIYIVHFAKAKVNDVYTIEKNSTIPVAFSTPFLKNDDEIKQNFLKTALQLELKNVLKNKNSITISSYDNAKDHLFHCKNLLKAFQLQKRNVLVVDATGSLQNLVNQKDYINISDDSFLTTSKSFFQELIQSKINDYDLCLINNQSIKQDKLAMVLMNIANENLLVIDSRKTAEKSIIKIELLKDEYHIPNMNFVLNKAEYNPSVLLEIKNFWNKKIKNNAT